MRFSKSSGDWMTGAGPILFGVGFIAPLIDQVLQATELSMPLGMQTLHIGLGAGLLLGIIAAFRGRWI